MINQSTKQADFITELREFYDTTVKFGGNRAVLAHLQKVTSMSNPEWEAHRDKLIAQKTAFTQSGTTNRLAAELLSKTARS